MKITDVLVLSPHPDDAVLGAGAYIYDLIQKGITVHYWLFSGCNDTLEGTDFRQDAIIREDALACQTLGIERKDCQFYDLQNMNLAHDRQNILQAIYSIREGIDLIIAPHPNDTHQDHQTVAQEAIRAVNKAPISLLQYPVTGSTIDFNPNYYHSMSIDAMKAKMKAIDCYKTQRELRHWWDSTVIWSAMGYYGIAIGKTNAEAFTLYKGIEQ